MESPDRKKSRTIPFTPMHTKQGDADTCRFHTLAKLIVRAVFDPLLKMTEEDTVKYQSCMPLETPMNATYSEEKCSKNGYLKIMLFYYFFELTQQLDLHSINGPAIQQLLNVELMPPLFDELKPHINTDWFGYQVQLSDPDLFPLIQEKIIKPVLDSGFYLELGLESERTQHLVLIVGVDDGLVIKNSWDDVTTSVPFLDEIELEGEMFSPQELFFILDRDFQEYEFESYQIDMLFRLLNPSGGKKRRTKYGQRRNHHQSKVIRANRKRTKTNYTRRLSKY